MIDKVDVFTMFAVVVVSYLCPVHKHKVENITRLNLLIIISIRKRWIAAEWLHQELEC